MDPLASGTLAPRVAGPPPGAPLPSARASLPGLEDLPPVDFLASGAQSTHSDICTHGKGTHCGEEGFAEEADGELKAWELSEETCCPPREQTADLFNEDWDLELKADQGNPYDADDIQGSISQEIKPWVRCAPQGDMVYDPSWHHPPPLIPHYSKMVFETGQFDDAED
ncbi:PREDICTED: coordinator of PRMT5 and differentiation stimulator [Dipodomys ordii]|uniref:Coordinator of PRMT5 and differentiation stimulator n=1 Tax=Dipodomys ordii TaxID=10020 RepID=A0A1S3FNL3_DIPOR|nr:PREDICTED: coordinator of PRMT5 and differentiation stimulator [Dipodomys ordii]